MKFSKSLLCMLAVFVLFLTSCMVIDTSESGVYEDKGEYRTESGSDNKQDNKINVFPDNENEIPDENTQPDGMNENEQSQNENDNEQNGPLSIDDVEFLSALGLEVTQVGEYDWTYDYIVQFCDAIGNTDKYALAEMINGNSWTGVHYPEYYPGLDELEFDGYTIYKCTPTSEKISSMEERGYAYVDYGEVYFAVFKVTESNLADVKIGDNSCFLSASLEPSSAEIDFVRSVDNVFDIEKVNSLFFCKTYDAQSENEAFIGSFSNNAARWFVDVLKDGKTLACDLDLYDKRCFISHMMSDGYQYKFSFEEINDFIKSHFDGHSGFNSFTSEQHEMWVLYEYADRPFSRAEKIYGCAGHGGSWIMYDVIDAVDNGETYSVTFQIYADYAKIAKAKKMTFVFDNGAIPKLLYINVTENTGRKAAINGI